MNIDPKLISLPVLVGVFCVCHLLGGLDVAASLAAASAIAGAVGYRVPNDGTIARSEVDPGEPVVPRP